MLSCDPGFNNSAVEGNVAGVMGMVFSIKMFDGSQKKIRCGFRVIVAMRYSRYSRFECRQRCRPTY